MTVLAGLLAATTLTASTLTASTTGSAATSVDPSPGAYFGLGFDSCAAPPSDVMAAWLETSPYRAVGVYIGGVNRACTQPQLTAPWVSTQQSMGWHLVPIYLGPQPPCSTSDRPYRFSASNAFFSGQAAADDAVKQARRLGLAAGSIIFNEIKAYLTNDLVCRDAVLSYQSAWTGRLHDRGFLSGFSGSLTSGVADQVAVYGSTLYVRPDYVWFSDYDGVPTVLAATIPSTYWLHRRVKQYRTPTAPDPPLGAETYPATLDPRSKSLFVDRNQFDLAPVQATPLGDFTGNGWSDVITREASTGALNLYGGNGTRFSSRLRIGTGFNGMNAIVRFGDFNRDGREDVIARERATGSLWLYRGTGTSLVGRVRIGLNGWNQMREITPVGDFDEDGYADLVAVDAASGRLFLYPGRGTTLAARRLIGVGWQGFSELVGVGDFNRDGHGDLLARSDATGELWLYPGARASFGARIRVGTGWDNKRDLAGVGDFDRDGFTDIFAVDNATGQLFRYPGRGTSFGPPVLVGAGWTAARPLL